MEEFVKTGLVRMEFHQFPLNQHAPGAQMGAQASLCAADQNQFWPYHDQLFQAASTRGQAGMTYDSMIRYATELGLDSAAFTQCLNTLAHQNDVVESLNQATELALSSTPSIIINGKLMSSPFNYNELKAEIESHLAASN
jgi:protein-disulfide isomerase